MKKRTKKTLSISGKVLLRLVLATVLCAIMYFSMLTIATGIFSEEIGYQLHEETEDGEIVLVEKHIYQSGEKHLTKLDVEDNQVLTPHLEVPAKTLAIFQVISQIMMLVVLAIFPYHILWQFGNRDDTNVRYKGQRPDPYRGLRVGAFAMVPYAVLWVLLLMTKVGAFPEQYAQVYRLANIPFMPFVNWVIPAAAVQDAELWRLLALLPTLLYVPVVCGIAYRLGHKQFSIREHLVFAKKETKIDEEI